MTSPAAPRILPSGEGALLVELPDARGALSAYTRLRQATEAAGGAGGAVVDLVPAARTVLVVFDPVVMRRDAVTAWVDEVLASESPTRERNSGRASDAHLVELPVVYDGPDLREVAAAAGLTVQGVIERHLAAEWTAAFIGFAPGFAYLTGDGALTVPRRSAPRAAVPAGSVALAAGYCGVYPRASPGGWQLIGTTDAELWDTERPSPALLAPGTRVRFVRAG
ncbi:allophanate hydrolase subunit 1 [Herbiconiux moechotypicola]|uniref:Allophanate hydrolase subunit 1 n=1 Tax=Herbiconiux moechotypicola TaxID=637393 RepID=A0ABN3D6S3_9MICO|nr:allophanate hydrolase subunit 1 [Herbiconiux moechotypicola]MCS5728659.1 allophanate hydrolase subunit 1 [Herbiconiux moechotypicola]